jgi:hypothetical protein
VASGSGSPDEHENTLFIPDKYQGAKPCSNPSEASEEACCERAQHANANHFAPTTGHLYDMDDQTIIDSLALSIMCIIGVVCFYFILFLFLFISNLFFFCLMSWCLKQPLTAAKKDGTGSTDLTRPLPAPSLVHRADLIA